MDVNLFKDFQAISSKQWKQKIQMDLNGAAYNTLITQTNDGINIKPFYHQDDFKQLEIPELHTTFKICQTVYIANEKIASKIAINALEKGANAILFIADKTFDLNLIFNNLIQFKTAEIIFKLNFIDSNFSKQLSKFQNINKYSFELDSINNYVKTGHWFKDKNKDFEISKTNFNISVDASLYQNAGANKPQQIAYALAHLNEYLNETLNKSSRIINITFSVGSDYFFEIAKLRAFRYLYHRLLKEYTIKPKLNIIVKPSLRNKTIYDYNINMLRTTTECMSAILGGANVITNVSYDSLYHKTNDFGERIARNQLLILKEESYFKEVNKTTKGAYYIEQITYELAQKALQLFKDIEKNNGFLAQLQKGTIQKKIKESALKEQQQFDNTKITLVGTNKFLNTADKMKNDLQLYPFTKKKSRKTVIEPIIVKRLAESLEQKRLQLEKN
ncbi:MAG: methylmalonyl-CoA mutase subunit beta [Flavobacteriaceae bacterium]|nr:methylmalonyl-CoA mutase subunit beta [Flavobacteriaceae bacterium]